MLELDVNTLPQTIETYLRTQHWMPDDARVISLEKPGEGNMNVVLRVKLDEGSLILKQARPYVQKYPQIPAPLERVDVECRFYDLAAENMDLDEYLPQLIGYDPDNYLLAMDDLGEGADYTFLYKKGASIQEQELEAAVHFLQLLHNTEFLPKDVQRFPKNLALRKLNHEHLFIYPYLEENGFNLDNVQPGLQEIAMTYKTDASLKKEISRLGDLYLSSGPTLLHGDYYPGSWLRVHGRFRVIDPEFCFFGRAEYDYGVMAAHFKMARLPEKLIEKALEAYRPANVFDRHLADQFTGMEILRRIIGLAQLPLDLTLEERSLLLQEAALLVKNK